MYHLEGVKEALLFRGPGNGTVCRACDDPDHQHESECPDGQPYYHPVTVSPRTRLPSGSYQSAIREIKMVRGLRITWCTEQSNRARTPPAGIRSPERTREGFTSSLSGAGLDAGCVHFPPSSLISSSAQAVLQVPQLGHVVHVHEV